MMTRRVPKILTVVLLAALTGCGVANSVAGVAVQATNTLELPETPVVSAPEASSEVPAETLAEDSASEAQPSDVESSEAESTVGDETSDALSQAPGSAAPGSATEGAVVRYLALGDSLTQGVGAPDESTGAFPALLAERWRAAGCEVELQNVGVDGSTVEAVIDGQLPQIEPFQPTVITFQGGGNDIVYATTVDDYRANVRTVLDAAVAVGARTLVFAQNEWFRSPTGMAYDYNSDFAEQRAAFDEVLIEEAAAHGAEFIDLRDMYQQEADDELWVEDGIHPTPETYDAWSAAMAEAVPAPCQ